MKQQYKIVGGGIAGLSVAVGLQKQGIEAEIFEQNDSIYYDNVGLGFSRNIYPIFKEWGILNEAFQIGAEIKTFSFVDKKFRTIASFKMKNPALSVRRPEFHKLLANQVKNIPIRFGKSISVEFQKEDCITIVADGVNSMARQQLYPQLKLRSSGQTLWRGIINFKFPKAFQNNYFDFIGDNLRFAIIHTGGDLYSWYAIQENTIHTSIADLKKYLTDLFVDFHPIVRDVISGTDSIYSTVLKDINPNDRKGLFWYYRDAVFIGDAIHPTTPNLANGACLAIEDAYVLTKLLSKYNSADVFAEFQKQRERKVNSIVRQSWYLGKMMHQKNPLINRLFIFGTRLMPQIAFDKIYSNVLDDSSVTFVNKLN